VVITDPPYYAVVSTKSVHQSRQTYRIEEGVS
jgi:hypothetical protein